MSGKRKAVIAVLSTLIILTLAFIWGNSCIPMAESAAESESTLYFMKPFFDFIFGKDVITVAIFRKIAHGSEFFTLSAEVCLLYYFIGRYSGGKKSFEMLSIGLFVAVADESIQILSKRGPMVQDVLIDFLGYSLCVLIFFVCYIIAKKIKYRKKAEDKKEDKREEKGG